MTNEKIKNQNEENVNHVLQLIINDIRYDWSMEYISGEEIRKLGNIPPDEDVFLAIKNPWEDESIPNDKQVNLARPEIEHFYSSPKEVIIVVSGTPHVWNKPKISFKEVIILAFGQYIDKPTMVYTVAYEDGPKHNPEGSMFVDQKVFVTNKMIFHATATDKS